MKLGVSVRIKADVDWRAASGGLKLQCIAIATFLVYVVLLMCAGRDSMMW